MLINYNWELLAVPASDVYRCICARFSTGKIKAPIDITSFRERGIGLIQVYKGVENLFYNLHIRYTHMFRPYFGPRQYTVN